MKVIYIIFLLLGSSAVHANQVDWSWQPAYTDETQSSSTGPFVLFSAIAEENLLNGQEHLTAPNQWGGSTTSLVDRNSGYSISCSHRTRNYTESSCVFPSKTFGGSLAYQLVSALIHRSKQYWGGNKDAPGFSFSFFSGDLIFHDKFGGGLIHCYVEEESMANMKPFCRIEY